MPSSACDWSSDVCSSDRSEEHTSELQSRSDLVCRLLLEKKKKQNSTSMRYVERICEEVLLCDLAWLHRHAKKAVPVIWATTRLGGALIVDLHELRMRSQP